MASPFKVRVTPAGNVGQTIRQLDGMKQSLKNKITRKWMMEGTKVIRDEARTRAPVLQNTKKYPHLIKGLLKRSMDRKVKTYKSGVTVGIVGPKSGFAVMRSPETGKIVRRTKKNAKEFDATAKKLGRGHVQHPAKYAHMLEFGTKKMAARPFLRKAGDAKQSEVKQIGVKTINEEMQKLSSIK